MAINIEELQKLFKENTIYHNVMVRETVQVLAVKYARQFRDDFDSFLCEAHKQGLADDYGDLQHFVTCVDANAWDFECYAVQFAIEDEEHSRFRHFVISQNIEVENPITI